MKKFFAVLAVAIFGLGFAGCPDKDKKEDKPVETTKPAEPTMTDAEAIVATYAKGQVQFKGSADGKFMLDLPQQCDTPPCKVQRKMGAMELKRGKLYLNYDGQTHVWDYKFTMSPRTMMLKNPATGAEFTLDHVK